MNQRGHTLIELVVAVIIVGVASGFAVTRYTNYLNSVKSQEGKQILIALWGAQKDFKNDNGAYFNGDEAVIAGAANFNLEIPIQKYFMSLQAQDTSGPTICGQDVIARITSKDNSYQLGIKETGEILCSDSSGGGCPHPACQRMGL